MIIFSLIEWDIYIYIYILPFIFYISDETQRTTTKIGKILKYNSIKLTMKFINTSCYRVFLFLKKKTFTQFRKLYK